MQFVIPRCLVKRLRRIEKEMSGQAHELFATHIPGGDMGSYAESLTQNLQRDFTGTMALLRNKDFQKLLVTYPRPPRVFLVAPETEDEVSSTWRVRGADGRQYGSPGGETVFEFYLGRGREGPKKFLCEWQGILQTDGYQAYDNVGGPKMVHVGCWAHARRKFVDAVKVNPQDAAAINMVTRMDALFLVDRHARQRQLSVHQRLALRREHADSWATEIHDQCVSLHKTVLPKSALGQAVTYTLNMWPKLRRCFDYAEVELSNNLAENSMRPVALGRKNWLHVGSAQACFDVIAEGTDMRWCVVASGNRLAGSWSTGPEGGPLLDGAGAGIRLFKVSGRRVDPDGKVLQR